MENQVKDIQSNFDTFVETTINDFTVQGGTIFCTSGCGNCCKLAVHTDFAEAQQIAPTLIDEQVKALDGYIDRLRQLQNEFTDFKSYLKLHRDRLGPCPFLDADANCGIYSVRPLTCRALLATRPADWCGIDTTALDQWDRQLYEQGLDKDHVAWPTHYLAATQQEAATRETVIAAQMRDTVGFSLAGNLPLLVWLARKADIDPALTAGPQGVLNLLVAAGINPAWVIVVGDAIAVDPQ